MKQQELKELKKFLREIFNIFNWIFYNGKLELNKINSIGKNELIRNRKGIKGKYMIKEKEISLSFYYGKIIIINVFIHELCHLIERQALKTKRINHSKTFDNFENLILEKYVCIVQQYYK